MKKKSKGRLIFNIFNITLMLVLIFVTLYPFINQLAVSLSGANELMEGDVSFFPKGFTFKAYTDILKDEKFWNSYKNTIIYTVIGTAISLILTMMCSFALSKKDLLGKNVLLKLIVFTMFFSGGLIPNVVLIKNLHLMDTIWAIIIPSVLLPYHILLMRTFFMGLPDDLEDASKIDGLGQFGHFIKIVIPLSKPIIATMTLFISVIYWNDWFSALIYLNDADMQPVTLYLRNIMSGSTMTATQGQELTSVVRTLPESTQAAAMLLVVTPILCIYPFVQKYFVKGVMIGAIKG